MKKFLLPIILSACFLVFGTRAYAYQITTDVKTKRIPAGTKLEVEAASDIYSDNLNEGDMFSVYLTRDVRTQTTMILPKGTVVRGNVNKVQGQKFFSRGAILYLTFDHVVAPNGSQIPIVAGIADKFDIDVKGGIKGGGGYGDAVKKDLKNAKNIIVKSTKWGIKSGDDWFRGGKFLVTPFSAIGGTIGGSGYFIGTSIADMFRKGNSVKIPKGTIFNILVLEPMDIPVSE